jgi:transitional endoplasmic reticulum ATPase
MLWSQTGEATRLPSSLTFLDRRSAAGSGGTNNVEGRVLASLLTEMDGIDGNGDGVFVIAATNRVESIDAALLRKGRFHHLLHVPPPTAKDKQAMVTYFGDRFQLPVETKEGLQGRLVEGMSGADVENLCREAGMLKIREAICLQQLGRLAIDDRLTERGGDHNAR